MSLAYEGNVQFVCTEEQPCVCANGVEFDCQCEVVHLVGATTGVCVHCAAPMVLIDGDSGAQVLYACDTGGWR